MKTPKGNLSICAKGKEDVHDMFVVWEKKHIANKSPKIVPDGVHVYKRVPRDVAAQELDKLILLFMAGLGTEADRTKIENMCSLMDDSELAVYVLELVSKCK